MTVSIGEMCRTLREQAGVSLRQMALLTHRDTSTLSRFERGHTHPRDVENLVRAYRELLPQTQRHPQRSDRPRLWPLLYLALSPIVMVPLFLAGPQRWDSNVARAWILVSFTIIAASILPTIVRDARTGRHPIAIVARAGYLAAIIMLFTEVSVRWVDLASPLIVFQAVVVIGLGMITIAYDRLERENAPTE